MPAFETLLLGDIDSMLQRSPSGSLGRSCFRAFQCGVQQRGRPGTRHSYDLGQRSVLLKAHSANVVHAVSAVAVAPQQMTERRSCDIELSWAEQRRLLEESFNATPAVEAVSSPSTSTERDGTRVHGAGKTGETQTAGNKALETAGDVDELSSSAVPLRWRRGRQREPERQSRTPSRRPLPSSLGKSRDRSASRRRGLRRASASLARARADVRRIRQRRRIPVNPLSKTEETAEQKLLARLHRELETGRSKFKSADDAASTSGRRTLGDDAVTSFIKGMGNVGLLSRQTEFQVASIIQKGVKLEEAITQRQRESSQPVTAAEIVKLQGLLSEAHLQLMMENTRMARDLMMQYNLRLVISIAKQYVGQGVELQDLIQEGIMGLTRAVDKFDPNRGFKFSTYSHWWIRQAVSRCVVEQSRVVRVPQHITEVFKRISQVRAELVSRDGRGNYPSNEEVAAVLGITPAKLAFYCKAAQPSKSLEGPVLGRAKNGAVESDPDECFGDTLDPEMVEGPQEHDATRPQMRAAEALLQHDIDLVLWTLPARERNVIRMRYGLHRQDGQGMTLGDLSAAYGLTKERIRQLEESALFKLRRHSGLLRAHLRKAGAVPLEAEHFDSVWSPAY